MHTPSTPEVKQPLSATDPRFSTSGILNAHLKEKNRQGLFSTYGGRTGEAMDVNKFTDRKIAMRDPNKIALLEKVAGLHNNIVTTDAVNGVVKEYNTSMNSEQKKVKEKTQPTKQ